MLEDPSNVSLSDDGNDLNKRFEAVKKAIRKAANEALVTAQSGQPQQFIPLDTSAENGPNAENDDPRVSFARGMSLFGQETASVEREVRSRLDEIEAELKDLVVSQEQEPRATETDDPEALQTEAEDLTHQIAILKGCSLARSYLDEATTHCDWVESARLLAKAQSALSQADKMIVTKGQSTPDSPQLEAASSVLDSIRTPLRRKRVDLLDRAEAAINTCCVLSSNSLEVRSPVEALDVIQALGAPLDALRHVTDEIEQQVFEPLLENHRNGRFSGSWIFREHTRSDRPSKKGLVYVLEWKGRDAASNSDVEDDQQIALWGDSLKLIQKVMRFVQVHLLLERTALCEVVGFRVFGGPNSSGDSLNLKAFGLTSNLIGNDGGMLLASIIRLMWDKCIPSCRWEDDKLAKLPAMAEKLKGFCESFEKEMKEAHFLTSHSQLSEFCTDFERKYAEKRRARFLGDARDLLLNEDYHNTIEVGVEVKQGQTDDEFEEEDGMSIFKLHKSSVSRTSSKLYDMCRGAMDEAVESSLEILPATLYRTARELLDLFRALVPATHGSAILDSPRMAAVFHNDCVFLAHQCLTLGLEYREKFIPAAEDDVRGQMLHQSCIFVDMVPPFRELANRSMGDMIEKQQKMIMEIVGSRITLLADALKFNESVAEWTDAETAIVSGFNHLRHLSHEWKPILSAEVYSGSLGHLVDTVFALYIDRVLEAKAISEAACHFVSGLFRKTTRHMSELVSSTRLWDRFTAIGRFMDMSLVEIESALAEGVFRNVTGTELSRLIMATFDNSEKRKRLLQALASDQQ